MIIKPPRRPKQDSQPGEFPFVMPTPITPDDPAIIPANIDPVLGNAPPAWEDYRPEAVREGDTIYALFPTSIRLYVAMVGSSADDVPPEGHVEPWGGVRVWNDDGSLHFADRYAVYHNFETVLSLEAYLNAGWSVCHDFPETFPRPSVFPFVMQSPSIYNYQFALLSRGANRDPYESENGVLKGVTWGLWDIWRPTDYLPGVLWGSLDVYIQYQTFVEFALLAITPTARRAAWLGITPTMTALLLASLFGSTGDTTTMSTRQRRRRHDVKTTIY